MIVMRRVAALLAGLFSVVLLLVGPGSAGPADAIGTIADSEVAALSSTGRMVEVDRSPVFEAAIDRANDAGVAVVVLDREVDGDEASDLAEIYNIELDALASRFHTVFVVTNNGYGAHSWQATNTELYLALDDAFDGVASGDLAGGLDAFVATLPTAGVFLPDSEEAGSDTSAGVPASNDAPEPDSDPGGLGAGTILLGLALLGGAFLLFRRRSSKRRAESEAQADLAADRAEIVEQLRANADRVITLGDRVIASGNDELIELYEQASASYQTVSQEVETAATAEQIDALDDRIDTAEWQFTVIEADLDGKPRPEPPTEETDDIEPAESIPAPVPVPPARSPRTGRTYPRT